ncbi:MAG: DUF2723 domain-containing protein [Bacteroidetes bacterium]|nr:MAG: DUF2723 domain-containing protein [Bacteroidota bacterium]
MKGLHRLTGWLVFAIATVVYFFSVERTGSLWDCGEFILGAYKLQVVHPPGAPLFLLVGRVFTWFAELFSDDKADIAFAVNMMSGLCTAFAAAFIAWITIILARLALVGREGETDAGQDLALAGGGLVAGLATAFATSIWFSAVEGEVYAMSTMFTALTLWAMVKWYSLPDNTQSDRWLIFAVYAAGLSTGVHLLSILTFPALALFYYFKKYEQHNLLGMALAAGSGVVAIVLIQKLVVVGIPALWTNMELLFVNGFGLPPQSGIVPTMLIVGGVLFGGLYLAHRRQSAVLQQIFVALALVVVAFSTVGIVVIRANAGPPVNMNAPTDAMRLLPYLNREQYGERPLLRGPDFDAQVQSTDVDDRYGLVGDRYEVTDYKISVNYNDSDKRLFPRMVDGTMGRPRLYQQWMGLDPNKPLPPGRPNFVDNVNFFLRYQIGWMYWRYFMWNFSGRQNGEQGFYDWDVSSGNWITGIDFIDEMRLSDQSQLPEKMAHDPAHNVYFMLPFLFGLLGMFWHGQKRGNDFVALLALFIITGIGIVVYSNQPPNEPRERDYVLAGSVFTFCIWIGMAVPALYQMLTNRLGSSKVVSAVGASALVLIAPALMGFQNFDDHSRADHTAARDYATNFLNSVDKDAIIFTYGDNDTYPLWYAQEVEGIRTDVRVVNLSLIAVDWYIDLLRRKVNDSAPIKMSIPREQLRGKLRNQVFYYNQAGEDRPISLQNFVKFMGEDHPLQSQGGRIIEAHYPTRNVLIPVDKAEILRNKVVSIADTANIVAAIPVRVDDTQLLKDDVAILDILASNLWERPIYFAVTARIEKLFGMQDYTQLEGLALRIVPIKSTSENQLYGMLGSGRVNTEAIFENVTTKWRWGNFDKEDTYVNSSYGPSVQSMQFAIQRGASALLEKGDKERAIQMVDTYFDAFPDMNFEFGIHAAYMVGLYTQAGAYDKAKPKMQVLARNTIARLNYFVSLPDDVLQLSFGNEFQAALAVADRLVAYAQRAGDTEYLAELQALFGEYVRQPQPTPELPGDRPTTPPLGEPGTE